MDENLLRFHSLYLLSKLLATTHMCGTSVNKNALLVHKRPPPGAGDAADVALLAHPADAANPKGGGGEPLSVF